MFHTAGGAETGCALEVYSQKAVNAKDKSEILQFFPDQNTYQLKETLTNRKHFCQTFTDIAFI